MYIKFISCWFVLSGMNGWTKQLLQPCFETEPESYKFLLPLPKAFTKFLNVLLTTGKLTKECPYMYLTIQLPNISSHDQTSCI